MPKGLIWANSLFFFMTLAGKIGTASAAPPSFQGLGDLPGGQVLSQALGVTQNGPVIVGSSGDSTGAIQSFLWTPSTGMVGLGATPGGNHASDVSADGQVIVGQDNQTGYRWTQTTGYVHIGSLPGGASSDALAVSANGSVIVGSSSSVASGPFPGQEAFRWTATGVMQPLGGLNTPVYSIATAVSANGSVVAGYSGNKAFGWTSATGMFSLGMLPGATSGEAHGISVDGSTIVGVSGGKAFRWTAGTGMIALGIAPGLALGASADGSVIVGDISNSAMIWDAAHDMRVLQNVLTNDLHLNLTGWTLTRAWDVSDDGQLIVGEGTDPAGKKEAWLVIVPEPSALTLLLLGTLLLSKRKRATEMCIG